jgi:WD40 repeat protein
VEAALFIIEQAEVQRLGWPGPGLLLLVRQDGKIAFYDTATRAERFTFNPSQSGYVHTFRSFSGDGRWLMAHQGVWDLSAATAALTAGTSPVPEPVNRYDRGPFSVHCLHALDQDGRRVLRYVEEDVVSPVVQQFPGLPDFEVQGVCPGPEPCNNPYAAALSDRFVVWFDRRMPPYKQALVYSLEGRALQCSLPHTSGIRAVVFSRDGRRLATAAGVTVRVWAPESGECVRKFKGQRGNIHAIAFHPSGRFLAVSCPDETVRFWEVESGKELGSYAWGVGAASHLAFSPDGLTVSAGTPGAVVVWDVDV